MKTKIMLYSLLFLLLSASSCTNHGGETSDVVFNPMIIIRYTDMDGNLIKFVIEDLSAIDDKGSGVIEVLSVTDLISGEEKEFFVSRVNTPYYPGFAILGMDSYSFGERKPIPKANLEYLIRYKIPSLFGEDHVEELKVKYEVNLWGKFTDAWYNQKQMNLINILDYMKDREADAELKEEIYKMSYCGVPTADIGWNDLSVFIPVDTAKIEK